MLRLSFIAFACALAGVVLSARILNVSRMHDYPVIYGINQWSPSTLPPGAAASAFPYTYNPSFIEPTVRFSKHKEGCLLARVQNYSSPGVSSPGPSKMVLTCLSEGVFSAITAANVVFEPSTPEEALGTEDPRVALVNGADGTFDPAGATRFRNDGIIDLSPTSVLNVVGGMDFGGF